MLNSGIPAILCGGGGGKSLSLCCHPASTPSAMHASMGAWASGKVASGDGVVGGRKGREGAGAGCGWDFEGAALLCGGWSP